MIKNFQELPVEVIAWGDTSYKLTFRRLPELLRLSVREVGVLNPLIVVETLESPSHYAIVTGWLRSQAAREVGENSLPCHVYSNFPHKILLLCAFFDNLGHRKMNLVEIAMTLGKLVEHYSQQELIENFLPLLGYRPHIENWQKIMAFVELKEDMRWALVDGKLSEQAALVLHKLPLEEGEQVFRLMSALGMSDSVQREVAEHFYEIWRRDELVPSALIAEEKWQGIVAEAKPAGAAEKAPASPAGAQQPRLIKSLTEGRNILLPNAKVRFSSEGAEARRPPKLQAQYDRAGEGEEAGDQRQRKVQEVREVLRRRRFPRLKAMEEAYNAELRALKLPPGVRITPAPYFETLTQKLEVQFNSAAQLHGVLEKLLDAEERGLLARLFAVQKG